MSSLDEVRAEIDEVDNEIAKQLVIRLALVRRACEAKRAAGRGVYDPDREIAIYRRLKEKFGEDVADILDGVVCACRNLEAYREASVSRPVDGGGSSPPPERA